MTGVLAVRLDSDGDVLLTGPAVRALAAGAGPVDLLVVPARPAGRGAAAGRAATCSVFDAPWIGPAAAGRRRRHRSR